MRLGEFKSFCIGVYWCYNIFKWVWSLDCGFIVKYNLNYRIWINRGVIWLENVGMNEIDVWMLFISLNYVLCVVFVMCGDEFVF